MTKIKVSEMVIIIKILLKLICAGLIVGLAGTIICVNIDAMTDIDAYNAAMIFLTIALISFGTYVFLFIIAFIFSVLTI